MSEQISLFDEGPGEDYKGMSQNRGQSDTSGESAAWISSKSGKLRLTVLWAIRNAPHGLTDEEGSGVTGIPANTWRPRRVELHKGWRDFDGGYVEDVGIRRKTISGRKAVAWVATEKGKTA